MLARADEIRVYDRRAGELAQERDGLQTRVSELEAERIQRESEFTEVDQARATLMERSAALTRAFTAKDAALQRAEETIAALNEHVGALESARAAEKQVAEQAFEELGASLRREQMQCSVVEGALETARKDFARLMREAMGLQRDQAAPEAGRRRVPPTRPSPASHSGASAEAQRAQADDEPESEKYAEFASGLRARRLRAVPE